MLPFLKFDMRDWGPSVKGPTTVYALPDRPLGGRGRGWPERETGQGKRRCVYVGVRIGYGLGASMEQTDLNV